VAGIKVESPDLAEAAAATRQHLDEATANSIQHTALVRQLVAQVDADPAERGPDGGAEGAGQAEATEAGWGILPTGDELAAEVERFLKGEQDR
jgi:hypothetical protein